jgi:hypothetical protein
MARWCRDRDTNGPSIMMDDGSRDGTEISMIPVQSQARAICGKGSGIMQGFPNT